MFIPVIPHLVGLLKHDALKNEDKFIKITEAIYMTV